MMTERDSFPDDVPVADAVEQNRPAAEPADRDAADPDEPVRTDEDVAPLEADESDWQEQLQVIEESDQDEFR
ncbi:hypothetical protein MycrhDRAFT_0966 [Mycolicibacterium rhodesiae JS60]|nr:hypothetical protein MycrhDRAFT_0966 [Mycolicibacterium rhodesiae JS60]